MHKTYNWGIIGPGKIAYTFAEGLQHLSNARLYAVASRSQQRADDFADKYKMKRSYEGYAKLVSDPEVDIVYVATPHTEHFDNTMMSLEKRKAVLCEKPMAMNAKEANTMVDTAKENNVFLMEALWTRFLPSILKLEELLEQKTVGDIQMVKADFGFVGNKDPEWRLFNKNLGGGSLLDVGIYPLFLTALVLGKPVNVKAFAKIGTTGVDDSCSIIMKYSGSEMAEVYSSIVTDTETVATIYGTEGKIVLNRRFFTPTNLDILYHDGRNERINVSYEGNGYNYEAQEVMDCLDKGRLESPKLPLRFSLDLMNLMDDIRRECGLVYLGHDR